MCEKKYEKKANLLQLCSWSAAGSCQLHGSLAAVVSVHTLDMGLDYVLVLIGISDAQS
jgi:hypothetical protein